MWINSPLFYRLNYRTMFGVNNRIRTGILAFIERSPVQLDDAHHNLGWLEGIEPSPLGAQAPMLTNNTIATIIL